MESLKLFPIIRNSSRIVSNLTSVAIYIYIDIYCDEEFAVFLDRSVNSFRLFPLLDILYAVHK